MCPGLPLEKSPSNRALLSQPTRFHLHMPSCINASCTLAQTQSLRLAQTQASWSPAAKRKTTTARHATWENQRNWSADAQIDQLRGLLKRSGWTSLNTSPKHRRATVGRFTLLIATPTSPGSASSEIK